MSAIAIYPPDASDPEIVYLQRNPQTTSTAQDLSSISSLTSIIPLGPAPPIPRKSSRRGLRVSTVIPSEPSSPVDSFADSSSPVDLPSASSTTSVSSDGSLDRAIKELEDHQSSHSSGSRPPSYSAIDEPPSIPARSPSHRYSTASNKSKDVPPEYQVVMPDGHPAGTANPIALTAEEKELLKQSFKDEEADAELEREESIYSMHMVEPIPEAPSTTSSERKTLRIQARGMNIMRLPLPSNELSILVTNPDESIAYTSTRARRASPDFTLSTPSSGDIIRMKFDRQPTLTLLQDDSIGTQPFPLIGKGVHRRQKFRVPGSEQEVEWCYISTRNSAFRRVEKLVLIEKQATDAPARRNSFYSKHPAENVAVATPLDESKRFYPIRRPSIRRSRSTSASSGILAAAKAMKTGKQPPRVLAQLVRGDDAWTQQGASGHMRAGGGGDLVLEPGCTDLVPEEVVVATALVMMKKEQDRLRAVQTAVIVAAIL